MAPKAASSAAAKKRKRAAGTPASERTHPIASTSTLPPPTPTTKEMPSPDPPPLSAVAARRAAASAVPDSTTLEILVDEDGEDSDEEELISLDSSSGEESGGSEKAAQKRRRKKLKKVKGRAPGAGRYFGGGGDEQAERIIPGFEEGLGGEEARGMDSEALESTEEMRRGASGTGKLGRGKRQRRERSAFTDPSCLSSFTPVVGKNVHSVTWRQAGMEQSGFLFCLQEEETLVIHGSFSVTPVSGNSSLLGAVLSAPPTPPPLSLPPSPTSTYPVFAPSSHPLPPLQALGSSKSSQGVLDVSSGCKINLAEFAAILLISDLVTGIEGVEVILRNGGLGCGNGMWDTQSPAQIHGNTWKLITELTPSLTLLRTVESWWTTLDTFYPSRLLNANGVNGQSPHSGTDRLVLMVEGAKRVGKSTFAKLLLNRLLSKYERVAYLDTDLGQPEFTTPGLVSLNVLSRPAMGPSFSHLTMPVSAHFLGATSPSSSPGSYLAAINSLLSVYSLEIEYPTLDDDPSSVKIASHIPLVINTQGWVKGLGADLLEKLRADARPSHVFAFASPTEGDDGEGPDGVEAPHDPIVERSIDEVKIVRMESAPSSPLDAKWSAADLRTLSFISYFHSLFGDETSVIPDVMTNILPMSWDFSLPLVAKVPFALNWTDHVQSVHVLDNDIPYSQVLRVLNGVIVGVFIDTESSSPAASTPSAAVLPYSPLSDRPPFSTTRSLGLALIRSIDSSSQTFHILSPLGSSSLPALKKISLVKGRLEVPMPLVLDASGNEEGVSGVEWKDVPYLSVLEGEGGKKKVRRNLMRRSQA